MKKMLREEPARLTASIVAAVGAVLALLVAFGVPVTDTQQSAILSVATIVLPLLTGFVIREQVYAPATVKKIAVDAKVDALEAAGRGQYLTDRRPGPDHLAGT